MTKNSSIKIVNNAPVINTSDLLNLHNLSSVNVEGAYSNENSVAMNPTDGIKVYIKSVHKLQELFNEVKSLGESYSSQKRSAKIEAPKTHLELTHKVLKIKDILNVFLNGLAVVHDENAKDFMMLLYNRFNFLSENLDLYYLTQNQKYVTEASTILDRLLETFEKMLTIVTNPENSEDISQVIDNAQLSV